MFVKCVCQVFLTIYYIIKKYTESLRITEYGFFALHDMFGK